MSKNTNSLICLNPKISPGYVHTNFNKVAKQMCLLRIPEFFGKCVCSIAALPVYKFFVFFFGELFMMTKQVSLSQFQNC